ncbi:MAG: ABC transporter ATP-binding protein [Clostridia bacterium]|nr:ABC transporter ATP-binding protein [Clostridia bacterium]
MNALLEAEGIEVRLGGTPVLRDVSLAAVTGRVLAVVGPNGSGKTTLLRALTGRVPLARGRVRLCGKPLSAYTPAGRARVMAVVPQEAPMPFALTVWEVVEMGRYPYLGRFGTLSRADRAIVREALERMGVAHLAERRFPTLSGGEKQRALLARALAQRPRVLLLDEPTANLDVNHALELLLLVRRLAREDGLAVVLVEHALAYARRFADEALALKGGRVFAHGDPAEVLSPGRVVELFDVRGAEARRAVQELV